MIIQTEHNAAWHLAEAERLLLASANTSDQDFVYRMTYRADTHIELAKVLLQARSSDGVFSARPEDSPVTVEVPLSAAEFESLEQEAARLGLSLAETLVTAFGNHLESLNRVTAS